MIIPSEQFIDMAGDRMAMDILEILHEGKKYSMRKNKVYRQLMSSWDGTKAECIFCVEYLMDKRFAMGLYKGILSGCARFAKDTGSVVTVSTGRFLIGRNGPVSNKTSNKMLVVCEHSPVKMN